MGGGRTRRGAYVLLASLALATTSFADDTPSGSIRGGNHTGFGRLVFDVGAGARYKLSRDGDVVTIKFPDPTALQKPPSPPTNVRSIKAAGAQAEMVVAAGAALREMRVDGRVVIDVLDPAPAVPPPPKQAKPPADPPKPRPEPDPVKASSPPLPPPAPKPAEEQAVAHPPAAPAGPVAIAAAPTVVPEGAAFTVPLGPKTGAAMFRRQSGVYVVFDERRPIDLAALHDNPVFGNASVRELQSGTMIAMAPAPPATDVSLTRTQTGWKIAAAPAKPVRAIPFAPKDGHVSLPVDPPGSVVSMTDPDTGATLLVGTLPRPGQAVATARGTAEFTLLPTLLGVVIEPLADSVAMRVVPTGFEITGGPNGLEITPQTHATEAAAAAVHLTRRFKLPAQSTEALNQSLAHGIAEAANTLPGARGPKRRAVASTMLSLGMGAEAEALLLTAVDQDPKEATSPDTIGLTAIAALVAGRVSEATGIDDPRLTGTDEIALWRGIHQAMIEEGSPTATATFTATAPLVLLYPPGIRDRILPVVAETMVLGGEAAAAKRLLALAGDAPGLGFARALLKQADGDAPGALAALDALALGRDQLDRARAAARAVELRLAAGQLDATKAADALDQLRYAWRGDRRELALRERIADLRERAGAWRVALSELRSAKTDFPDRAQTIQTHLMGMFIALLYSQATDTLAPLDLVALVDENADLFGAMPGNEAMQARLADRLMALDLPDRAAPLLEKLAASTLDPAGRATFGARLADLRLQQGDAAGTLAALTKSDGPGLEQELAEKRAVLASIAKARLGDQAGAIDALSGLTGPHINLARADAYEQVGNWSAAEEALMAVVGTTVPPAGDLTDAHRRLILRLATAAQRSGDRNGLAALRATLDSRLGRGPLADMIRLLTAEPVSGTADLPRAEREMGLARGVPAALAAFKGQ